MYASITELKNYLRITTETDDTLLFTLLERASGIIDDFCGRRFTLEFTARTYPARGPHISGGLLLLDADLWTLVRVINGDGTEIPPKAWTLRPLNMQPYFAIGLRPSEGIAWRDNATGDGLISVYGGWGYGMEPPTPISHATIRLAAWMYQQRDSSALPPVRHGDVDSVRALPQDVVDVMRSYVRLRFGGVA